jgi:hypothetical protein
MLHHLVGDRHQVNRLAPMAQLAARLLAALRSQALRRAPQPVAAGGLAAGVAVLGQARFQILDAGLQLCHELLQPADLLLLREGERFEFRQAVGESRHASSLHPQRKSA